MKKRKSHSLTVSQEAIEDFRKSSVSQRLKWLDEMRAFLSKVLSADAKRRLDTFRK